MNVDICSSAIGYMYHIVQYRYTQKRLSRAEHNSPATHASPQNLRNAQCSIGHNHEDTINGPGELPLKQHLVTSFTLARDSLEAKKGKRQSVLADRSLERPRPKTRHAHRSAKGRRKLPVIFGSTVSQRRSRDEDSHRHCIDGRRVC